MVNWIQGRRNSSRGMGKQMNTISSHQVLVVGGGLAGLRRAIEASKTW